jgi:hypothetical protein
MEVLKGLVIFVCKIKEVKDFPGHFAFKKEGNDAIMHVYKHVAHHLKIYIRTAINNNTFY